MALLYGWDITVPRPGSVESPDSAAEKWLDNFCYLEGALAVSGASGGSSGGHHVFPGVYGSTAGKHILGRSALTYVSASTEVPTGVPNSVWFDTSNVCFKYYHATSGWTEAVDFFPASLPASVFYNISFYTYGGSVDGRNYAVDGAKIDGLTQEARHMVVETGSAGSGEVLPWLRDRSYVAASGGNLILNGEFGYDPDNYTVLLLSSEDVGHWSTVFTDSSSAENVLAGSVTPASCASAFPRVTTLNPWKGTGSILLPGEKDVWNVYREGFIQIAASQDTANFDFGAEPFTIDFRMRMSQEPSAAYEAFVRYPIMQCHYDAYNYWLFEYSYNGALDRDTLSFTQLEASATTLSISQSDPRKIYEDTYHHIALIKGWGGAASAWMMCIDGVPILGSPSLDSTPVSMFSGAAIDIGVFTYLPSWFYNSNMDRQFDEFRVSKGIARWTSAFTPPTSAYEHDGGGMVTNLYWSEGNAATLTTVSGGYAGSCAEVVNGSTDSHIYQDVSGIVPEASYRYTFYVRSGSFGSAGSVEYYQQFHGLYDIDNSGWIVTFSDVSAASVWTQITQDFVAPAGCSAVRIHLGASSASATSYFDEVELYRRVYPEVRPASTTSVIDGANKLVQDGWWDTIDQTGDLNTHELWSGVSGWPGTLHTYVMALRFQNVSIPRGAIIEGAYLQLRNIQGLDCNIPGAVWFINEASCAPWAASASDIMNRQGIFCGNDAFPSGTFTNGQRVDSENLATYFQQLISRPDWNEGNAVGIRMTGPYRWLAGMSRTPSRWTAASSEAGSGPRFYVAYSTSAGAAIKIAESYASVIATRAASVATSGKYFWPVQCYLVENEDDGVFRKVVSRGMQFTGGNWRATRANYITIATLDLEEGDIT